MSKKMISRITVIVIIILTAFSVTSCHLLLAAVIMGQDVKKEKDRQAEEARQVEEAKRQEEARQAEAKRQEQARQVRGTILLYSDYAGTVLINGEDTQFTADGNGGEVRIIMENAVGKEYTLAVRDSAGIVHHDNSKILIENSRTYSAFIINPNPNPNDPADFDVIQNANGITIKSYKGTRKKVIIPETLYGQRVTAIGDSAFQKKGIVSVVIPNSIVTIGNKAFEGGNNYTPITNRNVIYEVVIPNSVTSIGSDAFLSCGLTKVTIGRSVRFIDDDAFADNNISELIIHAPLPDYNRKVTGKEWNRVWREYFDTYSQTLGLNPSAFRESLRSPSRVTLPANIHDGNLEAFPEGLVGFYKSQGKRAGIYVLNGPVWTRE